MIQTIIGKRKISKENTQTIDTRICQKLRQKLREHKKNLIHGKPQEELQQQIEHVIERMKELLHGGLSLPIKKKICFTNKSLKKCKFIPFFIIGFFVLFCFFNMKNWKLPMAHCCRNSNLFLSLFKNKLKY